MVRTKGGKYKGGKYKGAEDTEMKYKWLTKHFQHSYFKENSEQGRKDAKTTSKDAVCPHYTRIAGAPWWPLDALTTPSLTS